MQEPFLMEVGTGDVIELFQPDHIEQIVPVGDLPRVELGCKPLVVFPEVERRIVT